MELFSISCPTCQARLKVRSTSAIGQILSCPKCQSMVQVAPPPGWQPPSEQPAPQPAGQPGEPVATPAAAGEAGFERPFGFEPPDPPAWRIWAFGGVAAAVALMGSVSFFFGGAKPPENLAEVRQPPKYAGDGLGEGEPELDPKAEPAKNVEPAKQDEPAKQEEPAKQAPTPDLPKVDPTPVDPPKADPPKVETPQDPPKADPPKADPPKADPPKAEAPKTDPPKADPPKVDPPVAAVGLPRAVVEARLATKIESIQTPYVLLTDAVETLAQISGLRITLDLDALSQAGVPGDETVALDMQKTTVADVLDRILEERGLAYVIEAGQLRVTTRGKQRDAVRAESYDVADLCSTAAFGQDLAALVARVIEPGGWPEPPKFNGGKLEVRHNDWVHRRTAEFLRRLRVARNSAGLAPAAAEQVLASRTARAAEKLLKPLTVNYVDLSLAKIAQNLQSRTDLKLLFDALALAEAGQTPDAKTTYQTREAQPLANALLAVLQPFDLTFRIIDEGTLQITSKAASLEQSELEFYRVREQVTTPEKLAALIDKIRSDVFPGSWEVKADQPPAAAQPGRGQRGLLRPGIGYDALSGCLVVAHHQAAQMQVEDLLDTLRRRPAPAPAEGQQAQTEKGLKK